MSERMKEYNSWDFSDRVGFELPLSERVADTYDFLGVVGANWHPGEVAQLEADAKVLDEENAILRLNTRFITEENEALGELLSPLVDIELERDKLKAENDALREAAQWVFAGAVNAENPSWGPCPHGIRPSYPTHAWWCDDCFEALRDALLTGEDE